MEGKVKQTKVQKFREKATDEQWKEMVADHEKLSNDEFKAKYEFTWGAIMNDAVARGFYTKKKNVGDQASRSKSYDNKSRKDFIVDDIPKGTKKKQRSIELYEDIAARLNNLRDDKCQYTFASILNQLLDEALKKYGY